MTQRQIDELRRERDMEKDPDIRERIIAVHMRKSCDITERQTAIQMMRAPSWVAKWTTRYDEDGLKGLSTHTERRMAQIISEYYRTIKFNYGIMKYVVRKAESDLSNFGS